MNNQKQSSQNIIIRPYKPIDYKIVKRNLEEGGLFYTGMDSEDRFKEKIRRNPDSILVAEVDGKIVGNVLFVEDGWAAFGFRLAVNKKYRRRGIGTKLMAAVENISRKRGYSEIHILVNESEVGLKQYYSRIGYKEGNLYRWMYKNLRKSY